MPSDKETKDVQIRAPTKLTDSQLLTRVRKRFALMLEADRDNRVKGLEDMEFLHVPGAQWDQSVKDARGDRPCYEFNKTRIKAKRVVNEMRSNRPAGKVRAVEGGDKSTADVMEGLGRNITQVSDFDTIADYAGEYQVGAGMGAWRIVTEYSEDSFDQDIRVVGIPNPFNLYWDPASVDPMHRDAEDWCLLDAMSNSAFDEEYGDIEKTSFEDGSDFKDNADWRDGNETRVCEYHWREKYKKRIVKLADGKILDAEADAKALEGVPLDQIKGTRLADCWRVFMCIVSADKILTPPKELKGKYHRFIVIHGEWLIIKGKAQWCGVTRYAKDAQRAYNVASTAITETVASAPLSHYWTTEVQAKGNTDQWNKAIAENLPFLTYTFDPRVGGPPARVGGVEVPIALIQESQIRDQELKDVMGVYDASLGDKGNETSGRAITRRNEQGQIVNFNFPDNMAKGKQRTVEIINNLIPFYYDTERTVRVLGIDGAEDYIKINTLGIDPKTGLPRMVNDLTRGRYDVTVTVGPSYATQRQEAAETYIAMAAQDPLLMQTAPDLVYKSMDLPLSDQIAERRAAILPPQIQAMMKQGKDVPPEVKQALAILDQGKAQLDQQSQLMQAAAAEVATEKAGAEKAKADAQVAQANARVEAAGIATDRAQLATDQANFKTLIAEAALKLGEKSIAINANGAAQADAAATETQEATLQQALAAIEQRVTDSMQKHVEHLSALHSSALQSAQPQVFVAHPPQRKRAITRRVGQDLITEIEVIPQPTPEGVH